MIRTERRTARSTVGRRLCAALGSSIEARTEPRAESHARRAHTKKHLYRKALLRADSLHLNRAWSVTGQPLVSDWSVKPAGRRARAYYRVDLRACVGGSRTACGR
jgi:hypothetical protein